MSYEPPTPPDALPAGLADALADCDPEQLRAVATYADSLADHREREARQAESGDGGEDEGLQAPAPDSRPEGVPAKATLTTKTINDNRYYYWQWREGDTVTSKYHGPVDGDG